MEANPASTPTHKARRHPSDKGVEIDGANRRGAGVGLPIRVLRPNDSEMRHSCKEGLPPLSG
jgi:hypothetical protein